MRHLRRHVERADLPGRRRAHCDVGHGDREAVTSWYNLRPSCWLSTVPANGMVLSPEGGGGCSCGNWLETSIGFAPRLSRRQIDLHEFRTIEPSVDVVHRQRVRRL